VIGEATGIGVVLGDPPAGIVLQQPVQDDEGVALVVR
jgi:hypothetical protein